MTDINVTPGFTVDLTTLAIPDNTRYVTQDEDGRIDAWDGHPVWIGPFWGKRGDITPEVTILGGAVRGLDNPDAQHAITPWPLPAGTVPWTLRVSDDARIDGAPEPTTAQSLLDKAAGHMQDRASTYDSPAGERSMGRTVRAFNAITGHELTEEQGWLFQEVLKHVRSQQGGYRADNYEDSVAYAALRGETAARDRA